MFTLNSFITGTPIAHRGLWSDAVAENSMTAFSLCVEHGVPIECDLRIIGDGTIVVFHDDGLKRVCGKDIKLSELKKEDLKSCFLKGTADTIPTLQEFLKLVDGKVPVLFELKNYSTKTHELEILFLKQLKDYKGEFAVQSFNPLVLEYFRKNAPNIARGQLSYYFTIKAEKKGIPFIIRYMLKRLHFNRRSRPHFISYQSDCMPNRWINRCKTKNIPILAFWVSDINEYERITKYVDNVIFDHIDLKVLGFK